MRMVRESELEARGLDGYIPVSDELFLDLQEHYLTEQRSRNVGMPSKRFDLFSSPAHRLVMVGYITRLKGQEMLVRALERLRDKNEPLPYVTFADRTLSPESYYRQSDIAVSATNGGEGFDQVRIEAMLSGCLLIANDIGAAREIVKDGETGYLYENGDAGSLAGVIAGALKDTGQSRAIAARGQRMCMGRFTKRRNAEQVLALYREIMGTDYGRQEGVPAEF